jgi:hypothetical protein
MPFALVVWALYYIMQSSRAGHAQPATRSEALPAGSGALAFLRLVFIAVPIVVPINFFSQLSGWRAGLEAVLVTICGLLIFPWWTARNIVIPLRLHRLAYGLTWMSVGPWLRDKPEGPVLAAAWCLSLQRAPRASSIAWAEKKLRASRPLRASTVAAHAMLAAARKQSAEARALFESTALLHPSLMPQEVGRVCYEWLATDSAARGNWAAVQRFAEHYRAPRVPTLLLLANIAARRPGNRRASRIKVWIARLQIRQRLPGRDEIPIQTRPTPTPNPPKMSAREAMAMALHASIFSPSNCNAILSLSEQWESVLHDQDLYHRLTVRSTAIGAGNAVAATLQRLRRLVESDLVERLDNLGGEPDGIPPALLKSALAIRRDRLFTEIGERIARLERRRRENRDVPRIEEWREFVALHRAYNELCSSGSKADRSLAFSFAVQLNAFAVWLHDSRKEKTLANAMFRFLEREARLTGSPSYKVISRNASIGP